MASTDRAWEAWGKNDPYFGVVTSDQYRSDRVEHFKADFFAGGEEFVRSTLGLVERHFGAVARGRALDFGCGVGRLTIPLAAEFRETIGLDISPSMLAEATSNARLRSARPVFALSDDALSGAPGAFDFVNSYIVLQHIPTRRGLAILRQLLAKVAPGGGFFLHVSAPRSDFRGAAFRYLRNKSRIANIAANIVKRRPLTAPTMQMNAYPLHTVLELFHEEGVDQVLTRTGWHGNVFTVGFAGRKPTG